VLVVDNEEGRVLKERDPGNLRETRILPKHVSFTSEIYMYENKVTMIDVKDEAVGVIVEN